MIVNKKSLIFFNIGSDLFFLNISFISASILFVSLNYIFEELFPMLILLNIGWVFFAKQNNIYDEYRSRNFSYQFIGIIKAVSYFSLFAIVLLFLSKIQTISRLFLLVFIGNFLLTIMLKSYFLKKTLDYFRKKGKNVRTLLIIGAGELGINFSKMIEGHPSFGYNLIGFLDDEKKAILDGKYLGKVDSLGLVLSLNEKIDDVIVALPNSVSGRFSNFTKICDNHAVRIRFIPDYFSFLPENYEISSFGSFPIISLRNEPLEEIQWRVAKRIIDILGSTVGFLLIFTWLLPLIYIIQKITSPGPLFFIQDRVGKRNQIIKVFKFRTMHIASCKNDDKDVVVAKKEDVRITKLGKILRKTNIDELPQLINVFLGNMSLVGPRPHAISYNNMYAEFVDIIKIRHKVKPGITGWAQTHGLRGDVPNKEENEKRAQLRIKHDIWYVENWTFWLDIQIMATTIWNMIKGDPNAY